jgi:multidrug efflux pump subunit AcrB
MSVCISLLASLLLSFTLVPVLFKYLLRSQVASHGAKEGHGAAAIYGEEQGRPDANKTPFLFRPFFWIHRNFEAGFDWLRETYRGVLAWAVSVPLLTASFFVVLAAGSCVLYTQLGMDFFPSVDAGQMRLHVRAAPGTRIEDTQAQFAKVESAIRQLVGDNQIDVMLDNIGLPYSGINIALSDSATVGPMDGEILISLNESHTPTAAHMADLRRELPKRFAGMQFFFQPADIVNQVLNFGRPAPIDIRVTGPRNDDDYALAEKLVGDMKAIPGVVDVHIFQVPDAPSLKVDVDRTLAQEVGVSQRTAASSLLVSLNNSAQTSPNFWLNPRNSVSYPLVVQTPTYTINNMQDLRTIPLASADGRQGQLMMNFAKFSRSEVPLVMSQLNIRPVFDVNADVQGRDLNSAAEAIQEVIKRDIPPVSSGASLALSGQVETMNESFDGLYGGMGLAVILVFLLMVINFQSWLDPLIVLMAVPFSLAGVMWMLFLSQTHISVPALMGTLMCIGLTTANSILVVTFANDRMAAGDDALTAAVAAGYTRLRPVLMTAGAMILGMIPMALALGEGGEQNAPLARAVIGGLTFATFATLVFVPTMYSLTRRSAGAKLKEETAHADA